MDHNLANIAFISHAHHEFITNASHFQFVKGWEAFLDKLKLSTLRVRFQKKLGIGVNITN